MRAVRNLVAALKQRGEDLAAAQAENARLREALMPFASMGMAWLKQGEKDDSPWVHALDDQRIYLGASSLSFSVGEMRRAGALYETCATLNGGRADG